MTTYADHRVWQDVYHAATPMDYVSTLMRIQSAFENAGIRFLDNEPGGGIGVRLSEQKKS